jgi:uracil DNA glycosylase
MGQLCIIESCVSKQLSKWAALGVDVDLLNGLAAALRSELESKALINWERFQNVLIGICIDSLYRIVCNIVVRRCFARMV